MEQRKKEQEVDPFKPLNGESSKRFYFLLWKRYWDVGNSMAAVIRYIVLTPLMTALAVLRSPVYFLLTGGAYFLFALWLGHIWHKRNFMQTEYEIGNRFNKSFMKIVNKIDTI